MDMEYTDKGLFITLADLQQLLHDAQIQAKYHNMQTCIYITGEKKPKIIQYCNYAECNPITYTPLTY